MGSHADPRPGPMSWLLPSGMSALESRMGTEGFRTSKASRGTAVREGQELGIFKCILCLGPLCGTCYLHLV